MNIHDTLVCVADFEKIAKLRMLKTPFNYYSRGKDQLQTLNDSLAAFKRYRIRPRILNSTLKNLSTMVLGQHIDMPIGISPTALQILAHNEKEKGTARAACNKRTVMIVSSIASTHITDLHKEAASGHLWMQIYFFKTLALTKAIVRRAERTGFKALVVTVDSNGLAVHLKKRSLANTDYINSNERVRIMNLDVEVEENREAMRVADKRNMLRYALHEVNESHATEDDIKWLRTFTKLPIVLKGILSVSTARTAVSLGVDGILVSAHGGRQLDGVPAPIDALPDIVEAVKGSGVEVFMDGGIRNGTDVLKALALGARAVFVGRPILWGLATAGQQGVEQILQILKDELVLAMTLAGCSDVKKVPRSTVIHESDYLASKL